MCVCVFQSVGVHTQFVSRMNGAPTMSQFMCVLDIKLPIKCFCIFIQVSEILLHPADKVGGLCEP